MIFVDFVLVLAARLSVVVAAPPQPLRGAIYFFDAEGSPRKIEVCRLASLLLDSRMVKYSTKKGEKYDMILTLCSSPHLPTLQLLCQTS